MKVLVVGSSRDNDENRELINEASRQIGQELSRRGHAIVVGSDDELDVDPYVVEGAFADGILATVEVHVPRGLQAQYASAEEYQGRVATKWHQFPDWDVTSMEVVRNNVDGVLAIAGRKGVIHAGVTAWMMGKPVIPVGSFGGGAETLGQYGSSRRTEFYQGALNDEQIDRLASPWGSGVDAEFVVDALERVAKAVRMTRVPLRLLATVVSLTLLSVVLWVLFLTYPFILVQDETVWDNENNFLLLFPTVCAAGLLGAMMQTLRSLRRGDRLTLRSMMIDVSLGLAAGLVSAVLYLLAQIGVAGKVTVAMETSDYVRVAIIVSLVALFAALYLDAALRRFDAVSDSVISGRYADSES